MSKITIEGIDKLIKDLQKFGVEGEKSIEIVTEAVAREIESDAKQLAPKDTGVLAGAIKSIPVNKLNWKVLANSNGAAPYSAYMEFGTGGLVEVPEEMTEMAILFKGKGIREVNLMPQPYLYPAFVKGRKQYLKDLEIKLKHLTEDI